MAGMEAPSPSWVRRGLVARLASASVTPLLAATTVLVVLGAYGAMALHFVAVERSQLRDPATIDASETWTAVENWLPSGDLSRTGEPGIAPKPLPGCQAARTYNWASGDAIVLQLEMAMCVDAFSAYGVAAAASTAGPRFDSSVTPNIDTEQAGGPIVLAETDGRILVRIWSSGNVVHSLRSLCGSDLEACDRGNADLAAKLARTLPPRAEIESDRSARHHAAAGALLALAAALAAIYAGTVFIPRFLSWRRQPRPIGNLPVGTIDVGGTASFKTGARTLQRTGAFLVLVSIVRLAVATFMQVRYQLGSGDLTSPIAWGGLGVGALFWWFGRHALLPAEFRHTGADGNTTRAALGRSLGTASRWGLGTTMVLVVLTILGYVLSMAGRALHIDIAAIDAAIHPPYRIVSRVLPLNIAQVASNQGVWWLLGLLIGLTIALVACFGLGSRLASASLRESLRRDERPHVLLLRSFEEDEARVTARVLAPGMLPRAMTPVPHLPLEQVLAHGLTAVGPVIGIAPPGTILPQLGAAKTTLQHSEWRSEITRLASDALAIVVLATPTSVSSEGLGWELDLLAQQVTHARLMVVLGPYKEGERNLRWKGFCEYARDTHAFEGLTSIQHPGGLRVAVRSLGRSWELYGGAQADDATYLAAVNAATRSMEHTWRAEYVAG